MALAIDLAFSDRPARGGPAPLGLTQYQPRCPRTRWTPTSTPPSPPCRCRFGPPRLYPWRRHGHPPPPGEDQALGRGADRRPHPRAGRGRDRRRQGRGCTTILSTIDGRPTAIAGKDWRPQPWTAPNPDAGQARFIRRFAELRAARDRRPTRRPTATPSSRPSSRICQLPRLPPHRRRHQGELGIPDHLIAAITGHISTRRRRSWTPTCPAPPAWPPARSPRCTNAPRHRRRRSS
jgi:hypothetical protein